MFFCKISYIIRNFRHDTIQQTGGLCGKKINHNGKTLRGPGLREGVRRVGQKQRLHRK